MSDYYEEPAEHRHEELWSAIGYALANPGSDVWVLARTHARTYVLATDCANVLPPQIVKTVHNQRLQFVLINDSTIQFAPYTGKEEIRGHSIDALKLVDVPLDNVLRTRLGYGRGRLL
jgi:shikimate 5-dehydrogenase